MRVGVVVPEIRPTAGGGFTLIESLLGALDRAPSKHTFVVLHHGESPPRRCGGLEVVRLADELRAVGEAVEVATAAKQLDFIWFLSPDAEAVTVPFAATVWDLEHRIQPYFPEVSVSGWKWEEREHFYRSTLPRATFVATGSSEARRQVGNFYQVPDERILVVPFPIDTFTPEEIAEAARASRADWPSGPYLLYPAQFWPHKNHVAILHALRCLADEHGVQVSAVFTGADKGNRAHVERTVSDLALGAQVQLLGFVDRPTLIGLYQDALALAYPSFFGPDNLPPLEAFALGCPVIVAGVRGVEEQLGNAALYFDPTSEEQLVATVLRLLREPTLRDELVRRGSERVGRWTATDYVEAVVAKLDAFETIRRCWSRDEPYIHP